MSTRGAALTAGRVGSDRVWALWTAFVTGIAVVALAVAVMALSRTSVHGTAVGSPASSATSVYEQSAPVTGTGPDLVAVAGPIISMAQIQSIYRASAPVTGTGPDLMRVADQR